MGNKFFDKLLLCKINVKIDGFDGPRKNISFKILHTRTKINTDT